jgi:hypothetical protein
MAIAAVFAELRGEQTLHSGSSSRTRKIRTPSYDFALPWVSNCGANNTRSAMSKPHWTSGQISQQLRAGPCSEPTRKPTPTKPFSKALESNLIESESSSRRAFGYRKNSFQI